MDRLAVTSHVFTLGRLILLRLLYLSYIAFHELPESYESSRLELLLEAVEQGIEPLPTLPDYLGLSKWLTQYLPYTDLTRTEGWGLTIVVIVVFLGLIHGSCRRLVELLDAPTYRENRFPTSFLALLAAIARSTLFLPNDIQTVLPNHLVQVLFSLFLLINFLVVAYMTVKKILTLLVSNNTLNGPGGLLLNTIFIIFRSIFWDDWDAKQLYLHIYSVPLVAYLGFSCLYAIFLTLWQDIFPPVLGIFLTHATLKPLFPFLDSLASSLGLPYSLRDVQIQYPYIEDVAERIFGNRSTIRYHLTGLSDVGLRGRDELVLALFFSMPAVFFMLGNAHFVVRRFV
ncbi:hypothetical protein GGR58DRAFT_520755 [Xylaria digitata]|nr:hypothetical protein GGR58DRAFT_520755 [Xylaria digitata]